MNGQTLNMLKRLSPKKEYSLASRYFIGAAAIVLLAVFVHILIFAAIERHSAVRDSPEWCQLPAALSVDALYPLFIASLVSVIERVFHIPVYRLECEIFEFIYLYLGLIATSRINMYVGLHVFLMVLFAADMATYTIIGIHFFHELSKLHFISRRYYQRAYDKVFHHSVMQEPWSQQMPGTFFIRYPAFSLSH